MSGITGLVVTHAGLAPPGYTRTAVVAAGGSESTATVWTTKLPGKDGSLEPLVQIDVIIGDPAAAPAGFSVADISVTREPAAPAFLAFRRRGTAEEKAPITDLALDTPDTPAPEGYAVLEPPLISGDARISLAVRFQQPGDKPDWFGESVAVGDKVDAQNRNGVWWKGEVVEVTRHDVVVHFDGWDKLHDTFVPKRSDMIAPYDTETEGVDTRGTITADAEFEVSEESLRPYVEKIDSIISREASPAESELFIRRDLSDCVAQVLSLKLPEEVHPAVNSFVRAVIRLCCFYLATHPLEEKLPSAIMVQLNRVFLGDDRCNTFFTDTCHAMRGDVADAAKYAGFAAKLPPGGASVMFTENLNHFFAFGGHELLIRRIDDERDPLPLEELAVVLQACIYTPWRLYNNGWVKHVWPRIVTAVTNRLQRMDEAELRKHDKESLLARGGIAQLLSSTHRGLLKPQIEARGAPIANLPEAHPDPLPVALPGVLERTWAGLAARQLRVPSLPIRLKGLTYARELVRLVSSAEGAGAADDLDDDDDGFGQGGSSSFSYLGGGVGGYGGGYGSGYGGSYGGSYGRIGGRSGYGSNYGYGGRGQSTYGAPKPQFFTGPTLAEFFDKANVVQAVLGQVDENQDADLHAILERATPDSDVVPLSSLAPCATAEWEADMIKGVLPFSEEDEELARDRVKALLAHSGVSPAKDGGAEPQAGPTAAASGAAAAAAASSAAGAAAASAAGPSATADDAGASHTGGRRTKKRAGKLGPHEKLVAPLAVIMLFMAKHGALRRKHLDALWAANPGPKDESLRRAIFAAVGQLSAHLEEEMLGALYERITATPLDQLDDSTMDLVKSLSTAVLGSHDTAAAEAASTAAERAAETDKLEAAVHGVALYWRIITASPAAAVPAEIVAMAMDNLVELCAGEGALSRLLLRRNLQRCISHIAEGKSTAHAAELARRILEKVPVTAGGDEPFEFGENAAADAGAELAAAAAADADADAGADADADTDADENAKADAPKAPEWTRSRVIQLLQEDDDVIGLLLASLEKLRLAAAESLAAAGMCPAHEDDDAADREAEASIKAGSEPFAEGVAQRLAFLGFLINQSSATRLSTAQFTFLWKSFVEANVTRQSRSQFFSWLTEAQFGTTAGSGLMSDAELRSVFETKFCNVESMRFAAMRESDMGCMLRCFLKVNLDSGKLAGAMSAIDSMRSKVLDLDGMDALWHVATAASHEPTWRSASDIIVGCFMKLHPVDGPSPDDARSAFLAEIKERIRSPVKQLELGDATANQALRRLLETLRAFLTALDESGRTAGDADMLLVPTEVHDPNDPLQSRGRVVRRLYLQLSRSSSTLHEMRERLASALGHVASYLRVENFQHRYFESVTSEYCNAHAFSCANGVHALPHDLGDKTTAAHKDRPDMYPRASFLDDPAAAERVRPMARLTHDPKLFDALLSVVRAGDDDTADVAWDLISSVPTNVDVKRAVRSLGGAIEPRVEIPGEILTDSEEAEVLGRTSGVVEAANEANADAAGDGAAAAAAAAPVAPAAVAAEGSVDWASVLPDESPESMLYSIRLVRALALAKRGNCAVPRTPPQLARGTVAAEFKHEISHVGLPPAELEAESRREAARALWVSTFVAQGGLGRLMEILTSSGGGGGKAMGSRLGRQAMESLLRMVLFVTTKVDESGRELGVRPIVPEMPVAAYPAWVLEQLAAAKEAAASGDKHAASVARLLARVARSVKADTIDESELDSQAPETTESAAGADEDDEDTAGAQAIKASDVEAGLQFELHGVEVDDETLVSRLLLIVSEASAAADVEKARRDAAKAAQAEEEEEDTQDTLINIMQPSKNATQKLPDPEDPSLHKFEDVTVESHITLHALELLVRTCIARPAALSFLYANKSAVDSVLRPLIAAEELQIRDVAKSNLLILARVFLGNPALLPEGVEQPRDWLLRSFFSRIGEGYLHPRNCSEFYSLIAALITLVPPGATAPPPLPVDGEAVAADLAAALKAHPVVEAAPTDSDVVLRGTLRVIRALSTSSQALSRRLGTSVPDGGLGVVDEVFEQCLFFKPPPDAPPDVVLPPKCRSLRSRRAAFAALLGLASGNTDNASSLLRCILLSAKEAEQDAKAGTGPASSAASAAAAGAAGAVADASRPDLSDVLLFPAGGPSSAANSDAGTRGRRRKFEMLYDVKSATGYAGLVNLGCICYMNASNQQLFMIPELRRGLLEYSVTARKPEDSVTHQVQRMLANLQETQRRAYNPRGLCMALRDWDGNPINVMEQRDASEYLTQLFDKLETEMAGSKQASIIKDVLGGETASEFIADGARMYRARTTPFYYLSATVRHYKSLEESLRREFGAGDMMEGYRWEDDKTEADLGRFDTIRRTSLRKGPKHLIVHFKRLDIDVERGIPVKLNSRFEFPHRLNLWPYTVQGRADAVKGREGSRRVVDPEDPATHVAPGSEDDCNDYATDEGPEDFEYQLVGMVIHTGTATSGHYFSYVQERGADGPTGRWFEFNDQHVASWNPDRMEADCFGGEEEYTGNGYYDYKREGTSFKRTWVPGRTYKRSRYNNAFLAVYDKVPRDKAAAAAPAVAEAGATAAASRSPAKLARSSSRVEQDLETEVAASLAASASSTASAAELAAAYAARVTSTQSSKRSAQSAARVPVPEQFLSEIKGADLALWRQRTAESPDYFKFIRRLLDELTSASAAPPAAADSAADSGAAAPAAPASALATQLVDAAEELEREEEDEDAVVDAVVENPDSDSVAIKPGPVIPPPGPLAEPLAEPTVGYPTTAITSTAAAAKLGGADVIVAQLAIRFTAISLNASDGTVRADALKWVTKLTGILRRNVVACVWLLNALSSARSNLSAALLGHSDSKLREGFAALVRIAVRSVLRYETIDGTEELAALPAATGDEAAASSKPSDEVVASALESARRNARAPADADVTPEFAVEHGSSVRRLAEALLAELPFIGKFASSWNPVFGILQDIAEFGGPGAAAFLLARGAVEATCELVVESTPYAKVFEELGDFCPADIVAKAARSRSNFNSGERLDAAEQAIFRSKPSRVAVGGEFDASLPRALIQSLVCRCKPVSGSTSSAHLLPFTKCEADASALPLPSMAAHVLFSGSFLTHLATKLASCAEQKALTPLFSHLVWGTGSETTDLLAKVVREAPQAGDFDGFDIVPLLWAVQTLAEVADGDKAGPRAHAVLDAAVEAVKRLSAGFYLITERAIRVFCKLAARSDVVFEWFKANAERAGWMLEWLLANPMKPAVHAITGMRLAKKPSVDPSAVGGYLWRPPDMVRNARRLAAGERPTFTPRGFDDDDPNSVVGGRIRICIFIDAKQSKFRWLRARVVGFIKSRSFHRIVYDVVPAPPSNRVRLEHFRVHRLADDAPLMTRDDPPATDEPATLLGDPNDNSQDGEGEDAPDAEEEPAAPAPATEPAADPRRDGGDAQPLDGGDADFDDDDDDA